MASYPPVLFTSPLRMRPRPRRRRMRPDLHPGGGAAQGTPAGAPAPDRTPTILIVDDDADILESLRMVFEVSLANLRVLTVASGEEGLVVLRENKVDLIITDYKMPGMTGLEFLARVDEFAPGVPRILATAFPGSALAHAPEGKIRIDQFMPKPLDMDALVATTQSLLKRS